ncbi:MAG: hypothetical protein IJI41_11480 [Anaerolineaceae bacterium]|nr:hypothetical protein [Anaerolineaceae bacterium]MBR6088420.1 hypothetical protein [Anaerolineaceae bacterium]
MERKYELDVKDHLHALEHEEPWMEDLAGMIIEFTGCDTAIAAGRAVDLSEDRRFGCAVSAMTQGFLRICRELEDGKCMSENQKETMRQLLKGMLERLMPLFPQQSL